MRKQSRTFSMDHIFTHNLYTFECFAHVCFKGDNTSFKWYRHRWEFKWQPLGVLQQVPPGCSLPPPPVSGEAGWKTLSNSKGLPGRPQQHQPAGSQNGDGLQQPPVQLVSSHIDSTLQALSLMNFPHFLLFFHYSSAAHLQWGRRRRSLQASACPGGVCSSAGSCCCPSVQYPPTSHCCTVFSTAGKSPSSGWWLWACRCLRASSFCSLWRWGGNNNKASHFHCRVLCWGLCLLTGDRGSCVFCHAAETSGRGGDWGSRASAVRWWKLWNAFLSFFFFIYFWPQITNYYT